MEINKTKSTPIGEERHCFFLVKDFDPINPNILHVTASTDEIDRYDEIVQPESFRESLPSFIKNPVVLPAHKHNLDSGDPPVIGNVIVSTIQILNHNVDMDVEFDDDELGQKYARKYIKKKMMRAFSIGFRGLEGHYEQRDGKQIWVWTKIELLELSAVAVPANTGALSRVKGFYDSEDAKDAIASTVKQHFDEHFDVLKQFIDQQFNDLNAIIIANSGGMAKREHGDGFELSEHGGDDKQLTVQILNDLKKFQHRSIE